MSRKPAMIVAACGTFRLPAGKSVGDRHLQTLGAQQGGYAVQLVVRSLPEVVVRCLAVDGIDHHHLWLYGLDSPSTA